MSGNPYRNANFAVDETTRKRKRQRAERLGRWAETAALILLTLKGYRILARRARTPLGEIDLVAKRGRTVAFVEVKARPVLDDTFYAVSHKQQVRIFRAAEWYRAGHADLAHCDLRFDMIGIAPWHLPVHIADAFRP